MAPKNTGLYIHIPWCIKKCPYCDFNSHKLQNNNLEEQVYIEQLLAELRSYKSLKDRRFVTVFIGGGTPSIFTCASYSKLLKDMRSIIDISEDAEITIEANPGSFYEHVSDKLEGFRDAGINRLSIGVQSFNNELLNAVGRIHDSSSALKTIEAASKIFNNINIDLMYGLPGQTLESFSLDLKTAISLNTKHLSYYNLTIEKNTAFYINPPKCPDEDLVYDMYKHMLDLIDRSELKRYEISAYAKHGYQCKHNLNYWRFGDYLGLGAGAHSKLCANRMSQWKHPSTYLNLSFDSGPVHNRTSHISEKDLISEFMINRLRLLEDITELEFEMATGISFKRIYPIVIKAQDLGLLIYRDASISTTDLGYKFLNDLTIMFM